MIKYIIGIFILLMTLIHPIFPAIQAQDILRKMDELQTMDQDVTAKVKIIQQDKDQGVKTMESIYFAKDLSDLFLIVMIGPESEKGNGYLKSGKNFWMYRRNTRTFQHISRNESIAGSDANAEDFENPKYATHYAATKDLNGQEIIETELLGKIPVYKLEIRSKIPDVSYPKKRLWVRQDNFLPLKEQNFSLSGTLMRTNYFLAYTQINGKYIPTKQMAVDEFEKGNKTVWEISNITFKKLDDSIFSKAYLENLSK